MKHRLSSMVSVILCAGCTSFAEATVADPGSTARLTLTVSRPASDGSEEPVRVEGRVVTSTLGPGAGPGAGVTLEQRVAVPVGNFRDFVTVDTVSVLQPDIRRLEIERFSWFRSGIALVALGAVIRASWQKLAPSVQAH